MGIGMWEECFQEAPSLIMALSMVSSLRMEATKATLPGLPAATNCS